ncbi:MAG: ABC transporter substrate-binding protein [Clostridia bacterium]|nr:ABC transporter substrate-binding protein [Clostridia bacterium]
MGKIKLKNILVLFVVIALIFVSVGCANNQNSSDDLNGETEVMDEETSIELIDMTGEKVIMNKSPEKIVSLSPANTEILFDLGLDDKIVGVTEYCDYPEEAKNKQKVGDFDGPNIEVITSIMPDLVVAGGYMHEDAISQLKDLGIVVISSEANDFNDIYNSIEMIGKATATEDRAEQIVAQMKSKVDEIKNRVKDKKKPKVFFIVEYGTDLWTVSKGSFMHDAIEICGGINIAQDGETPWCKYSMEKVVEKNPDAIFITKHVGDIEQIKKDDVLKNTDAMKNQKLFVIDDNIIVRGTPRIVEGLEVMYECLYEEK